jgi:hypothetical protein
MNLYIHSPIRLYDVVLNWLSTGTTLPLLYIYTVFSWLRMRSRGNVFAIPERPVASQEGLPMEMVIYSRTLHSHGKADIACADWEGF